MCNLGNVLEKSRHTKLVLHFLQYSPPPVFDIVLLALVTIIIITNFYSVLLIISLFLTQPVEQFNFLEFSCILQAEEDKVKISMRVTLPFITRIGGQGWNNNVMMNNF